MYHPVAVLAKQTLTRSQGVTMVVVVVMMVAEATKFEPISRQLVPFSLYMLL